jgi:7,8-dihydroneopterin aldolase/epimerase/oxygenase
MDVIALRGVRAHGRHGANPGERDAEQPFDVDLSIEMDLSAASQSDDLGDTLNYADLHERVVAIVQSTSFVLLERLGAEIVNAIFRDARVVRAEVAIGKPGLLDGATPTVLLRRENPRYRAAFP